MGLDIVELIVAIEDTFGIEIPDRDAENLATVGSLADYVYRALRGRETYKRDSRYNRELVERIVILIVSDKCGIKPENIERRHSFTTDLGMD